MTATAAHGDTRARRNAVILAVAQALYGAAVTVLIVTAGLVGTQLSKDPSWATLPVSAFVIGTALTTLPVSLLMRRIGRKAGFMMGSFAGTIGGLLGVYAIYQRSFGIFLAAAFLVGIYQASASYYRFAAADMASPAFRPKAISWVMTGGLGRRELRGVSHGPRGACDDRVTRDSTLTCKSAKLICKECEMAKFRDFLQSVLPAKTGKKLFIQQSDWRAHSMPEERNRLLLEHALLLAEEASKLHPEFRDNYRGFA